MNNWEVVKEMVHHIVDYYAYILKYFPRRILGNMFNNVK